MVVIIEAVGSENRQNCDTLQKSMGGKEGCRLLESF